MQIPVTGKYLCNLIKNYENESTQIREKLLKTIGLDGNSHETYIKELFNELEEVERSISLLKTYRCHYNSNVPIIGSDKVITLTRALDELSSLKKLRRKYNYLLLKYREGTRKKKNLSPRTPPVDLSYLYEKIKKFDNLIIMLERNIRNANKTEFSIEVSEENMHIL